MRLTKLEMNGFKSFAKKTEIDFQSGITAVIGPNGSGKSNIADAVRWVLGEQSARVLRGSKMEDVIFSGTEQRKAQSFCEVTLTFDNADGDLPTEYSEVSVTRRVYRSGDSEYCINRQACRLRDIHELFRDTGIGKEGYSIIGQGKVEEILSNKSNERRAAFEEAAGVMKYRVRKEEAERKLENTRKNLLRLNDILEELGNQVGPLEEQSAVAREYLRLRDELKDIEINVFLYQHDRWHERLKKIAEEADQLEQSIAESTARESSLASDCAAEEERERALGATMSELQNRLMALSTGVEVSSGEAKVMQERLGNLIAERQRLEGSVEEHTRRNEELKEQLGKSRGVGEENRTRYTAALGRQRELEGELSAKAGQISRLEELLESQKNSIIDAMNRLADTRSLISGLEAIRGTLNGRLAAISGEEAALREKGAGLEEEFSQSAEYLAKIQAEHDELAAGRAQAIELVNQANSALQGNRQEASRLEQECQAGAARIKVLEEMKRAHEGYYASVRNVLRDSERNMELRSRIEGVVAELLKVPAEYETAIEMAMGSALQNIVTPTEQDGKYVIEYLRAHQYGRATLLPVSTMRPRLLTEQEKAMCRVNGYIGVASELVGYDARYRGIFENLLGRTVLVKDLDAGIAINRRANSQFRIATLKGDIINPGGSMTGGSVQKREFSLIGREREIAELSQKLDALLAEAERKKEQVAEINARLEQANASVGVLSGKLHDKDVELATQREKTDIIKTYVQQNIDGLERLSLERSQIADNIADIDQQCREAEQAQTSLAAANVATQDDVKGTQQALARQRNEHAILNDALTEHKVSLMALEKEYSATQSELMRMDKESKQLEAQIAAEKRSIEEFASQFSQIQGELKSLGSNIDVGRKDIEQLTDQLHSLEEERTRHQAALDEARERRATASVELKDFSERRHRLELNQSKLESDIANLQSRIWDEYELTYDNAQHLRREIAVTAAQVRVGELRRAIKELGNVNVSAIEDYKNLKQRFESLGAQCQDLEKAEADLKQLIGELVGTMEREFRQQFALIQRNFAQTFMELFGGGRAELLLADSNDILNCEIDIIAQPPGKKLQLLSLLSGGERALTAIALLFAILKLKPTAFCILDEIESSLDEVNVTNFAQYIKNYSKNTQFILITHRKGSMEVCDSLYGVAMEERGVSKVVSAKFGDIA